MRYKLKEQDGFTLIIAIISLAVMSILGIAILSATTSNFKMTKTDSISQSTYYIAEAGVNNIIDKINEGLQIENKDETKEEFFERIEKVFSDNKTIKTFEKNNGKEPQADIKVDILKKDENTKEYTIISTGKIGESKRVVSSKVTIGWDLAEDENNDLGSDIILKTSNFSFNGSDFNALGKTIIIGGQNSGSMNGGSKINAKNIYFKGLSDGVISGSSYGDQKNPGDIYLEGDAKILSSGRTMYGNVHTNGNFTVTGGVEIHGDLIVKGNLVLTGGSNINGNVYVDGNLTLSGGTKLLGNVVVLGDIDADGGSVIEGKLMVDNNAKLVSVTLNKGAEIRGNLELGWTPTFNENVYYGGTLKKPNNFSNSGSGKFQNKNNISAIDITTLPSFIFTIPECEVSLKEDNWYSNKGYEIKGNVTGKIPGGSKWFVDNYNNTGYQAINDEIVIISKGDIKLRGGNDLTGALIAPNGKVEYSGGNFNGTIISNNEIKLSGWGPANIKSLEEYFGSANVPVDYKCKGSSQGGGANGGSNTGEGTSGKGKIISVSGIKEQ